MKTITNFVIALALIFSISTTSFAAGLGGAPDDSGSSDSKGLWIVVDTTDNESLFIPNITIFNVVKVNGEFIIIFMRSDNKQWTAGEAVKNSNDTLSMSSAYGFTAFEAVFTASGDTSVLVINTCVVYEDESCAAPGTALLLNKIKEESQN